MERVSVNLANLLPRSRFESFLCTTRREGALADLVAPDVVRLSLARESRFDLDAVRRLTAFIAQHRIRILHAHGSSLFIALAASLRRLSPAIVWHVHNGPRAAGPRVPWAYRVAAHRVAAVISVSEPLAEWVTGQLGISGDRVWYIPNFACDSPDSGRAPELPGHEGVRVVCVANLRPVKGHLDLLQAFAIVAGHVPDAHLLLVGDGTDPGYVETVRAEIARFDLTGRVSLMGERRDVPALLRRCDVAVLSSRSEGFPLALVEYGMAGLPVVATSVGQVPDILGGGDLGILTAPGAPGELACGIVSLLRSAADRRRLGRRFQSVVQQRYSSASVVRQVCHVYDVTQGISRA
jgi:glycosyltransferase involved in cell wall biosynthesis